MKQFLEGKRVFKQENSEVRYLFLQEERIKKYHYFYGDILIKKGDLLYPNRWIKYENVVLLPLGSFKQEDYEYVFFPSWSFKHIQTVLKPLIGIELDEDLSNLLTIDELPSAAESGIRERLNDMNIEPSIVEAYTFPDGEFIVLDEELTGSDIVEECTEEFANKTITNIYYNHDEHLYQIEPKSSHDIVWYHSRPDESNQFSVLREIWDIDDMIPFTKFQLEK